MVTNPKLNEAAEKYYAQSHIHSIQTITAFKAGAAWQKEQSNWISIDKELPEPNVKVLICESYLNDDKYAVSYWDGTRGYVNNRPQFPDGQDEQPGYFYPTHWQPLPKSPKNI